MKMLVCLILPGDGWIQKAMLLRTTQGITTITTIPAVSQLHGTSYLTLLAAQVIDVGFQTLFLCHWTTLLMRDQFLHGVITVLLLGPVQWMMV